MLEIVKSSKTRAQAMVDAAIKVSIQPLSYILLLHTYVFVKGLVTMVLGCIICEGRRRCEENDPSSLGLDWQTPAVTRLCGQTSRAFKWQHRASSQPNSLRTYG